MQENEKTAIVLGGNADIGNYICHRLAENNYKVYTSYRNELPNFRMQLKEKISVIQCDVSDPKSVDNFYNCIRNENVEWDLFFSSIGTTEPIGNFFKTETLSWNKCFSLNFIDQVNVLKKINEMRNFRRINDIIFMAGGGTNGVFDNYSAYTLAKICLIKFCELMDSENEDMKFTIIGPGFVKTKTHFETIKAGNNAGKNYTRVKRFLEMEEGTPLEQIFDVLKWVIEQPKEIVGGRNFSVVNDDFFSKELYDKLNAFPDMYKLRRFMNNWAKD